MEDPQTPQAAGFSAMFESLYPGRETDLALMGKALDDMLSAGDRLRRVLRNP
jgi:hypothetical protein